MLDHAPDHTFQTRRGAFRIWTLDTTLVTEVTGVFESALVGPYIAALDDWERRRGPGLLRAFHDWERLEDYDMKARLGLTEWTLQHRHEFERIHVLTTSKLVQYGVAAANIVLRGLIVTYAERAPFERAFAQAVGGR
ncbi:MAG: hypothetical protein HYV09_39315 [Deltaproteobacteria bacterium]|nr:hypothetical protein [Deltaproteobacteria bacterium]